MNTTSRPWWDSPQVSAGKNSRPVTTCWLAGGRVRAGDDGAGPTGI
jgi:hypothetical protein